MPTIDFITQSFCCVDDKLRESRPNHKHSQAKLYPSEVVTLALLYALKGCGREGITVPSLPHPPRLFRLFNSHGHHLEDFLADPSLIGVIDSYGIELLHPIPPGGSQKQIGRKGKSNKRWIVERVNCAFCSISWV